MKIGFIKKRFNPFGGAENYMATVMSRLSVEGHEIHVFSSKWEPSESVSVHKVGDSGYLSFLSILSFNRNAAKKVKEVNPFCTISFERVTCGDIYRAGDGCHAEWLKIRRAAEGLFRGFSFAINPLHRTLLKLEKDIFRNTPIIVANSKMVKRQIIEHYGNLDSSVRVIYNGVDLDRFSPRQRNRWRTALRLQYGIGEHDPLVLFIGSGFERKGLKTLLDAMARVDAKLFVVGKGDASKYRWPSLKDKALFLGPQNGIERFYAASDLFVLPTLYDPFSNASLEAMASGLPVITTRNNGASELIENGHNGYVLDEMLSGWELADKINLALENLPSMGKKARMKAEGFSIEKTSSEFIGLIRQCAR